MAVTVAQAGARSSRPRLVFPDVARGFMLLSIALANVVTAWAVNEDSPQAVAGLTTLNNGSTADALTIIAGDIGVHVRGLPLFCTLLGFGIGLISNSLLRRGFPRRAAKRTIAKRYGWLAVFGAIHCLFLFYGDIMMAYGIFGMLIATMIGLSNRALAWIAGIIYAINAAMFTSLAFAVYAVGSSMGLDEFYSNPGFGIESYAGVLLTGLVGWFVNTFGLVGQAGMVLPPMLIGLIFARKGYGRLTKENSPVMWIWFGITVLIAFGVGIPKGLANIGKMSTEAATAWELVNIGLGPLTGPGLFAFFALACAGVQKKVEQGGGLPVLLRPVVALGKRSMTGYVGQSILFLLLVYPFTLNITQGWGAAQCSLLALGVWLATALGAWALEANGLPGPLEKLHRRLSYGAAGLPERWEFPHALPGTVPPVPPVTRRGKPSA